MFVNTLDKDLITKTHVSMKSTHRVHSVTMIAAKKLSLVTFLSQCEFHFSLYSIHIIRT